MQNGMKTRIRQGSQSRMRHSPPFALRETNSTATGTTRYGRACRISPGIQNWKNYFATNPNAVYWLEIIDRRPDGLVVVSNITEGAKRKVENVQAAIEPELLYPLLRGRDVNR